MERRIFDVAGMPVTAYALCLFAALVLGIVLLRKECKRTGLPREGAEWILLFSLPLGLIGARFFYVVARWSLYEEIGFDQALRLWDGGYAIWGAIGGGMLAGALSARILHRPVGNVLDAMAAPSAAVICVARLAEYFSGQGIGPLVEAEGLQFFPLAVYIPDYEEWHFAVFLLEAMAAFVFFLVLMRDKPRRQGDRARLFLLLYSTCQVLLESLRRDEFLRWLFVRVSQLTAAIVLGLLIAEALFRRSNPQSAKAVWGWLSLFILSIAACVGLEFAVDKSPDIPVWAAYCMMAFCCVGMGIAAARLIFPARKPFPGRRKA